MIDARARPHILSAAHHPNRPTNKPARERRALIEWHAFCSVSKFAAKRVSTLFRHFSINHFASRVGRDKGLFLTHAAHTPECKIDWTKKLLRNKLLLVRFKIYIRTAVPILIKFFVMIERHDEKINVYIFSCSRCQKCITTDC
jgi:hypothetical protein